MGEFDLIGRIRRMTAGSDRVPIGIGDDCASIAFTPGYEVLVTTDMLLEGRHFLLDRATPQQVGYKCLAVNLSDIAAMAGVPVAAVVAVALPRGGAEGLAMGLIEGMAPLLERFGVALAGGDTNAWDGPLVVSMTLFGECPPGRAVRRSGAKPGDAIFLTGPLGGSLLGRHLSPTPRIHEAHAMARVAEIHAMIDLSDGLSSDLGHMLEESRVGAILDAALIPIHRDASLSAREDGRLPLDHALNDGEDFELCLAADESSFDRFREACPGLVRVGTITAGAGLRLRMDDGRITPFEPGGFDHLARY